jgi:predicted transcriptional regulator
MNFLLPLLANKYIVGSVVAVTLLGAAYMRYNHVVGQRDDLEKQLQIQTFTNEQQKETIKTLQENCKEVLDSQKNFTEEVTKLQEISKDLDKVLNREQEGKKSLGELAKKKKTLIEKKVNNATQKVFECFESISRNKECG